MTVHYTPEFLEHAKKVLTEELPPQPVKFDTYGDLTPGVIQRELAKQAAGTIEQIRKNQEAIQTGGYIPDRPLPWTSPPPKFITQELLDMEKLFDPVDTPEIMFDLETLDLKPRAVVVSLGAVAFNVRQCSSVSDFKSPLGEGLGLASRSFYRVLDIPVQQAKGRTIDGDTVRWWMSQGDEAKKLFAVEPWHPYSVIQAFSSWVIHNGGKRLWANPTVFDVPKLESLFEDFGAKWPFSHRDYRDLKTLKAVTSELPSLKVADLVAHHALDDAIYQALSVQRIYRNDRGLRAESDGMKQNKG